jgi:sugar O-acyltransferase (sialic acid O-acetyltransferase NeuD family)
MRRMIVIWGAGGYAMCVADVIRLHDDFELVGFLDDVNPDRAGTTYFGSKILGGREQLEPLLKQGVGSMILGFGNNASRLTVGELVRSMGFQLATALHPRCVISAGVPVGAGTVIRAGAVVEAGASIGENVIIGACASVGHGSVLEDGVRVNAGANVAGNVTIGRATTIGTGVAIKDRIHIGANTLIGAGAAVVRDIGDGVVAFGTPARVARAITPDDY